MGKISYKGLEILGEIDRKLIESICEAYFKKLGNKLNTDISMGLLLKEYHLKTSNKEFSVEATLNLGSGNISADEIGWDLSKVVHRVFEKIINQVEHRFHLSDKHKAR